MMVDSNMVRGFAAALGVACAATAANAAVIFEVSDLRPGETTANVATTTLGAVTSNASVPTMTYTVTGVDLTSVGGSASEQVVIDVDFTQTGGTGVQFNGFGNISVTGGGNNNQVDGVETLTATVSLSSTTYTAGDITLGFISFTTGGVSGDTDEQWNITTASGTTLFNSPGSNVTTFAASSFVTLDPVAGNSNDGDFNAQGYIIELTATQDIIPEPASLALLSAGGFLIGSRRRR